MKKHIIFLLTITLTVGLTYQKCCKECVSKLVTDASQQAIDSAALPSVTTYEVPIKTADEVDIEGFCGKVFSKYGTCCNQSELEKRAKAWTNRLKKRANKIVQGFSKMNKLIDNIGKIEKWMKKHKEIITNKSENNDQEIDDDSKSSEKSGNGILPKCNNSDGTMSVCGGPTGGKPTKPESGYEKKPECDKDDNGNCKPEYNKKPNGEKKPECDKDDNGNCKPEYNKKPNGEKKPECDKDDNGNCKPEYNKKPNGEKKPECIPKEGETNCGNTNEGKPGLNQKPTKPKEETDDTKNPKSYGKKTKKPKWKKQIKKPNAKDILKLGNDLAKLKKGDKTKREKREKHAQSQLSSCYNELMKIRKAALCMRCSGAASDFYDSATGSYKIKPYVCSAIISKCATVFAAIAEANNLYTNLATLKKAKGGTVSDDAESESINDVELGKWQKCGDDKLACAKNITQIENLCKQISLSSDNQALEGNIATTSEGIASGDAISSDADPSQATTTEFYSSPKRLLIAFLKNKLQRNLQEETDDGYGYVMPSNSGADLSSEFSSGFEMIRVLSAIGFLIACTIML